MTCLRAGLLAVPYSASMNCAPTLALNLAAWLLLASGGAQAAGFCAGLDSYKVNPIVGGAPIDLCRLDAKAVLLVNTASACGFTPQYEGLEKLNQRYAREGLRIVGLPANDFGAQERGSNQQIAEFCQVNYGVTFTVGEKLTVPIRRDPLYAQLVRISGKAPQWNFHKYLIGADGRVQSFDSNVTPQSRELVQAIEVALKPAAR
jgi:glutathione peroxidase